MNWQSKLMCVFGLVLMFAISACSESGNAELREQETKVNKATPEERLAEVKSELKSLKGVLAGEGAYNCCVQPACDWCLLQEGECECYDNLKADKKVCPGCGLGWHNGKGVIKGIEASQVKWDIAHEHGEQEHEDGEHKHAH